MRKCLMTTILVSALGLVAVSAQTPPDTKGWHGAEWGMAADQVAAATGTTLGAELPPSEKPHEYSDNPAVTCRRGSSMIVGRWTMEPTFCFGMSGKPGLSMITLRVSDASSFDDLRAELKARYGDPTSEEPFRGQAMRANDAKWLLPSTAISLQWISVVNVLPRLSIIYERRTAPIL